jgi:hypothetical protein
MDTDAFAALTTDVISALTSKQLAGLSTDLASALTQDQAGALQTANLLGFMGTEVSALVYGAYPDLT